MIFNKQDGFDLIVGASGQDGFYLKKFLQSKNKNILCLNKNGLIDNEGIERPLNICDKKMVEDLLKEYPIERIFYLAAYHHSAEQESANLISTLKKSMAIHVYAFENFITAIKKNRPNCKIFYAASSHLFSGLKGNTTNIEKWIDEDTPLSPQGWYSLSKSAGVELINSARKSGIHAISGFLFNHESVLRPRSFLSSKLSHGALDALKDKDHKLELLDINTSVDWGYAPDYVQAMHLILEYPTPQDYIIATGKLHKISDYAEKVYALVGLNWKDHVRVSSDVSRKIGGTTALVGNSTRLRKATGWTPATSFDEMVALILFDTAKKRNIQLKGFQNVT